MTRSEACASVQDIIARCGAGLEDHLFGDPDDPATEAAASEYCRRLDGITGGLGAVVARLVAGCGV